MAYIVTLKITDKNFPSETDKVLEYMGIDVSLDAEVLQVVRQGDAKQANEAN